MNVVSFRHSVAASIKRYLSDQLPGWQLDLRIGLLAFAISLFFAFPSLWQWLAGDPNRINEFLAQAENPWRRDLTEPILYYRFLVPLINYGLGLRGFWAVLPAVFASFLNLCLLGRLVRMRTQNVHYALLLSVGFGLTFFITEGTTFLCSPDSVAHGFVMLLAAFDLGWLGGICLPLGALLVDERSFAALAFLLVFRFHQACLVRDVLSAARSTLRFSLCLLIAFLAWKGIRVCLDSGVWAAPVTSTLLAEQSSRVLARFGPMDGWAPWIVNALAAFKWMYLFPVLLTIGVVKRCGSGRRGFQYVFDSALPAVWVLNLVLFALLLVASMFNGDVWRTVSFGYLFVIEAAISLYQLVGLSALRLALMAAMLMLITPVVYVAGDMSERVAYPMPLVLWRTFGGGKGVLSWLLSLVGIHRGGL